MELKISWIIFFLFKGRLIVGLREREKGGGGDRKGAERVLGFELVQSQFVSHNFTN